MAKPEVIVMFVNTIFLSAIKKRAEVVELKCGRDRFVIDFIIDGERVEEMRPPLELRSPIFDRLRQMSTDGLVHLLVGVDAKFFTVTFVETGAVHRCEIRPVPSKQPRWQA